MKSSPLAIRLLIITVAAVAFGVLIPGFIADGEGVLYRDTFDSGLERQLGSATSHSSNWLREVVAFERQRNNLEEARRELDRQIGQAYGAEAAKLVEQRRVIDDELRQQPEVVIPLYGSILVPLWFWTILMMGVLIAICPPGALPWKRLLGEPGGGPGAKWVPQGRWRTFWFGFGICLFFQWPTLWRVCYGRGDPSDPPRPLYFNSLLAGRVSFGYEMMLDLLYGVLLANVILQWIVYARRVSAQYPFPPKFDPGHDYIADLMNPSVTHRVTDLFDEWIVVSVLLASSYMFDTLFYWHEVTSPPGKAYLLQAVLEHTVWGGSWLVLSAPLLISLRHWNRLRTFALKQMSQVSGGLDESSQRLLEQARPLSGWVVVIANAGAVATFVATLLHAIQ